MDLKRHFKILKVLAKNSFMVVLANKRLLLVFLSGKLIKFVFYLLFIYFLLSNTSDLVGYSRDEVILFFLTFNLIDILAQFLYREVYRFRPMLISGSFDLILAKPVNALFRILFGGIDVIDFITIPPLIAAIIWVGASFDPTLLQVFFYMLLVLNGLIIATAFHIAVIALGIITLEIDYTLWIYRDVTELGKFPIEIYAEPLRSVLTYLIPVGVMIAYPVKSFLGVLSIQSMFIAILVSGLAVLVSVNFWKYALRFYTSASS